MAYEMYYDAALYGFTAWTSVLITLPFVAAVIFLFSKPTSYWGAPKVSAKLINGFRYFYLCMTLFFLITSLSETYSNYLLYKNYVENNEFQVVEGVVTNFQPYVERRSPEEFCVNDVCFKFRDYLTTWGFNQNASDGGPIHEGLQVRIAYVEGEENIIVRLEIGK